MWASSKIIQMPRYLLHRDRGWRLPPQTMEKDPPANATDPQHDPHIVTKQNSYRRRGTQWPLWLERNTHGPLDNRAAAFVVPNNRNTYIPHTEESSVTGIALEHYGLLDLSIPTTRGYRLTGTFRLFPLYLSVPTVSKHDNSIVVATDLLQSFWQVVPTTSKEKTKVHHRHQKDNSGHREPPNSKDAMISKGGQDAT